MKCEFVEDLDSHTEINLNRDDQNEKIVNLKSNVKYKSHRNKTSIKNILNEEKKKFKKL